MAERLTCIYFCIILLSSLAGYELGEYLRSAEDTFSTHQQAFYCGTFPKISNEHRILARKMQKLRLQFLTIAGSAGGFLLGILLVSKTDAAICEPKRKSPEACCS